MTASKIINMTSFACNVISVASLAKNGAGFIKEYRNGGVMLEKVNFHEAVDSEHPDWSPGITGDSLKSGWTSMKNNWGKTTACLKENAFSKNNYRNALAAYEKNAGTKMYQAAKKVSDSKLYKSLVIQR